MSGFDFTVRTKQDLIDAVHEFGFVPLFRNTIPGFSVEDHVAREAWFGSEEGVWEWKGPVIRESGCAYGKFFGHKAAFISMEWFPDFANYRRDGYDFDALYDDGLASYRDRELFELLDQNAPVLSGTLKEKGDYRKGGKKGFDTIVTRLQAECYVVISDFVYQKDRFGNRYGWGVAEYSTPEKLFGDAFRANVYRREPEESLEIVLRQLEKLLPGIGRKELLKFIR